jgi:hypothetical protein
MNHTEPAIALARYNSPASFALRGSGWFGMIVEKENRQ